MATMNLRRATTKTKDKSGAGGGDRAPEKLAPDQGDIQQISSESLHLFLPILTAESLNKQISNIKTLFQENLDENIQIICIIVVQWWFNCVPNSPVRRAITGCLNQVKDENYNELIIEQISRRLKNDCVESEGEEVNSLIKNIYKCMDNFKSGELAIIQQIGAVVPFIQNTLQEKIEGVCEEDVTPVDKAALTDQALEIIRGLVAVTKGRFEAIDKELKSELQTFMFQIIYHGSLPLDLRSNAGIVYIGSIIQETEKIFTLLESTNASEEKSGKNGAKLCLAHGVLSCFSLQQLAEKSETGETFMYLLLKMYLNLSQSNHDTGIVLGCSRGLMTWSGKLVDMCKQDLVEFCSLLEQALDYTWNHFEHQIDSVKHNTKDFLTSMIQVLQSLGSSGQELISKYLKQTLALPLHKKARFPALSTLIKCGGLDQILEVQPNFRQEILAMSEEYALVGPLSDLYENIIKIDFKKNKDDLKPWYKDTVHPLVKQLMMTSQSLGSSQLSRSLLGKCGKLAPNLVEMIFEAEPQLQGKPGLFCLKLGRELGIPWKFEKHRDLLEKSTRSTDIDERLQTLSLLAESHSSVEAFSQPELDLIQELIEDNLSMTQPASRHEFQAHIKKIFTRIYDGALTLLKKLTMSKFEKDAQILNTCVKQYNLFINTIIVICCDNMFPGSNFARRGTVLEILTLLHEIFKLDTPPSWLDLAGSLSENAAKSLYTQLYDSYENNKAKSLMLLKSLPPHLLGLTNPNKVKEILQEATQLIRSNKPSSCLTAGYLFKLILTAPAAAWAFADELGLKHADHKKVELYAVVYVRNLLSKQLSVAKDDLLYAAAFDPMYGAIHVIRCIYAELALKEKALTDNTEMTATWTELTKDLIDLGYQVWKVVAPVVASDSPEGHLPMDNDTEAVKKLQKVVDQSLTSKQIRRPYKLQDTPGIECKILDKYVAKEVFPDEIAEDILEDLVNFSVGDVKKDLESPKERDADETIDSAADSHQVEDIDEDSSGVDCGEADMSENGVVKAKEVSSQMLLLCAWRSVKEVSLLLGDLCQPKLNSLLTSEQILEIASFLMDLLSQTKHRGAFEQAYVAFTQLCSCLWTSSRPKLHSHPSQLLLQLLSSITNNKKRSSSSKSGLCATRRSAGVPFIVQAIVSTDPDPNNAVFKSAMDELIGLAMNSKADQEMRVHAMNILRALFRDTRLGDCVTGYVERGVQASITGFKASNWAERNAATLLFSALITRIFGVKREKDADELSVKNCLTGKVFFLRYPDLHCFLLKSLEECVLPGGQQEAGTLQLFPMLYPLLLLLSRLFPAPSESLDNPYKLSAFIPLVERCGESPVMAIRKLAAKALVALIDSNNIGSYVEKILKRLDEEKLSSNHIHGLLLQLYQLKRSKQSLDSKNKNATKSLEEDEISDIVEETKNLVIKENDTKSLIPKLLEKYSCPLISAQYLDILLIEEQSLKESNEELENVLTEILFDNKVSSRLSYDIWGPLLMQKSCEVLTKIALVTEDSGILLKLCLHPELEVRLKALQLYINRQETCNNEKKELITKEDVFNLILCEQNEFCLSHLLKICLGLDQSAFKLEDAAYVLSLVQVKQNEGVLSSALLLSAKILCSSCNLESKPSTSSPEFSPVYTELADTLKRFSATEQPDTLRMAVAQTLLNNPVLLKNVAINKVDCNSALVIIWSSLLDLVYDDEDEIREICSQISFKLSGNNLAGDRLASSLIANCLQSLAMVWPAAAIFIVLGHVISLACGEAEQDSLDTENDKAFDKGEMNTYRELETTCKIFLPLAEAFMRSLSPKLLERTAAEQLPSQLIAKLLPCLPGSVVVYSLEQLAAYVKTFSGEDTNLNRIFQQISATLKPSQEI